MLCWNQGMYMDEEVSKKPGRYRRMAEKPNCLRGCYCITLPANKENCMDIYSTREYWFRHYGEERLEIIGLAEDRESAWLLVGQMAQDIVRRYGAFCPETVRAYFAAGGRLIG